MKFLVVGSYSPNESTAPKFQQACKELGATLARQGHILLVATDDDYTADRWISQGANDAKVKAKVILYRPAKEFTRQDEDHPRWDPQKFPHLEVVKTLPETMGRWGVSHAVAINFSDGVILVGGGRGTLDVGYMAYSLAKPVLAVRDFGGSAKEIWDRVASGYRAQLHESMFTALQSDWTSTKADAIATAAVALVRYSHSKSATETKTLWVTLLFALALLILWGWLFFGGFNAAAEVYTFSFVGLLFGIALRTTLRAIQNQGGVANPLADSEMAAGAEVTLASVLAEVIVGLVICFTLTCLCFLGNGVYKGDLTTIEPSAFKRLALVMTFVGIAAGALLREATEKVIAALHGILKKVPHS